MSLRVWVAGSAHTAYRRQLKQDQTAITIVADLISGDTQGAGAAIAQALPAMMPQALLLR